MISLGKFQDVKNHSISFDDSNLYGLLMAGHRNMFLKQRMKMFRLLNTDESYFIFNKERISEFHPDYWNRDSDESMMVAHNGRIYGQTLIEKTVKQMQEFIAKQVGLPLNCIVSNGGKVGE